MSATLRVSDFTENQTLFPTPPPIINISSRQHPVTVHFNRRTPADYVSEAVRKAIKIHSRLPPGGILIFMTGQNEILTVCRKLEKRFGKTAIREKKTRRMKVRGPADTNNEDDATNEAAEVANPRDGDVEIEEIDLGTGDIADDVDGHWDHDLALDDEALDSDSQDGEEGVADSDDFDVPMHIIPLYSLLSSDKQMRVFQPPPDDCRLVVVATNVAETSITIPGIRYVVDCGRAKQRFYDVNSGIQSFRVGWISKASASQRAGRAGRTGPGHCYRLYSSSLYENYFDEFAQPEILRMPIDGVVLQMKSMHIDAVINFPFPTPPDRDALKKAEKVLTHLGALETPSASTKPSTGTHVTDLGKVMAMFPVSPRFSKMLVAGRQHGCLPYVIAIVAALSVGDPFIREDALLDLSGSEQEDDETPGEIAHINSEKIRAKELRKHQRQSFFRSQQRHASLGNNTSDVFRVLSVVGAYEFAGGGQKFCHEHFVRAKAMEEIHKLRAQITNIVQSNFPDADHGFSPTLAPPSEKQIKVLRQLLTAGFIDQVAIRKDLAQPSSANGTTHASARGVPFRALNVEEDVFIHPSSVLFHAVPPDFVVFQEVVRTSRVWIKSLTVVNPAWLATLGPSLCTFSKPIPLPATFKDVKPGEVAVIPRFGPGWELPPLRRVQ